MALITTPLAAQQIDSIAPLTLEQAIAMAQSNGHQARAAMATRDAAVYRNREYHSRLLPQLSMNGTIPSYNRSIIQVVQPDGTTLFRPQDQTNATLNLRLSQKLPVTGGDLFISSSLARLSISGQQSRETWSSTPFTVGIRQDIFRPNVAAWEAREQSVQTDLTDRQYLEARENIALTVTGLFFDVFNARMSLANAENNVAINDTLFTLNKGRFEVGKIGENDLLDEALEVIAALVQLYREQGRYLERIYKWLQRVGRDSILAAVVSDRDRRRHCRRRWCRSRFRTTTAAVMSCLRCRCWSTTCSRSRYTCCGSGAGMVDGSTTCRSGAVPTWPSGMAP